MPPENVVKFIADVTDSDWSEEVTFSSQSSSQWTVGDDTSIWLFNVTSDSDENDIFLFYKPAAIESVKALFASAAPIEGVNGIVIHENCVERDNRYDLMIAVEMEKAALPNWDASEIHHRWKNQFGGMLEKKAIFDYED